MISKSGHFTLYDNVTIRRAKIIINYNGNSTYDGILIGSIIPCNPTNDVVIYNGGSYNSKIVASADGNLYAKHESTYTYVTINCTNYTSYWSY